MSDRAPLATEIQRLQAELIALREQYSAACDEIGRLRDPATRASTHSGGCWRWRHHHECAIDRVEMLEAENARLRRALDAAGIVLGSET